MRRANKRRTSGQEQTRRSIKKQDAHTRMARSATFYLAADALFRLKPGGSNSKSQGHDARIKGKAACADWGYAMARSVVVHLGHCTLEAAQQLFNVIEFVYLLIFRHFLVSTRHEVRLPAFVFYADSF